MTRFIKTRADKENKPPIQRKEDKVTRLEIINHSGNLMPFGRMLVMYKETGDFNNIEVCYQDGGKTLKIFID